MGFGVHRFVNPVDQNLLCSICAGVLENAIITPCGHSFCELCLQTWLERPLTNSCPSCRSDVSVFETIPVLALRGIVDGLAIQCDNFENGCKMVVKLDCLDSHLKSCGYSLVECSACATKVNRNGLAKHHQQCEVLNAIATKKREEDAEINIEKLTKQVAALEMDLKKTKTSLNDSENEVQRVKRDLREMRFQLELHSTEEQEFDADWDPEYGYGYSPYSIAQLAGLISRFLLNKPYYMDRNRIFNAVKRCYDYYHTFAGYSQDVHMLLATSYASNWFTENQRVNFDCWLQNLARERFLSLG